VDDELSELLRTLKAAEDVLQSVRADEPGHPHKPAEGAPEPAPQRRDEERKIALGDVAKARKDYEREPLDRP
jgi:hypothetical protein